MVALSTLALTVAACSTTPSPGAGTSASTVASGSPWMGAFEATVPPSPVNSLTDVTCATALRCWAVGSTVGTGGAPNGAVVIASSDGGATWSNQVIPPQVGYLSRIACSTKRDCTAVGQAAQTSAGQAVVIGTDDGGATWALEAVPADILDVTAVSCEADRKCTAIGTTATGAVALTSTTPLSGWSQLGALPAGLSVATAISCTDDSDCWVTAQTAPSGDHVTSQVVVTTDGGSTWATVPTPSGLGYLNDVSCIEGSTAGSGALPVPTTTTAPTAPPPPAAPGAAPSTTTAPTTTTTTAPTTSTTTTTAPIVGVAGARCAVVGTTATSVTSSRSGHGVLLTSDNGGAVWTSPVVPISSASLAGVSCVAVGQCVAVGSTVAASIPAGMIILTSSASDPWKGAAVVDSPQSLAAVSCLSLADCVVVGESIIEYLVQG